MFREAAGRLQRQRASEGQSPNEYAKQHPTVKGQEFIEWLIRMTTDEGDTVVDPFVGSGTVAAAAKATGRHFIVGDVSAEFCEIARKRLGIASFPPAESLPHPDSPGYFHNYKEVFTEPNKHG